MSVESGIEPDRLLATDHDMLIAMLRHVDERRAAQERQHYEIRSLLEAMVKGRRRG